MKEILGRQVCLVDGSSQPANAVGQGFVGAPNDIHGKALSCEKVIPVSDAGKVDPSKVNVVNESGASQQIALHMNDAAACEATPFAWYDDDVAHATGVVLCPGA